ncbi:MAG: hypothetical protein QM778_00625 [Myxococcales bacterium]
MAFIRSAAERLAPWETASALELPSLTWEVAEMRPENGSDSFRVRAVALLLSAALAAGCTHHYWMPPPELNVALPRSSSKRIAVVLARPKLENTYKTSVQGHTYYFEDVFSVLEQTFERGLRGQVKEIKFFRDRPDSGFDAYIFPELAVVMDGGMFKKTCSTRFSIVISDAGGGLLSRTEHAGNGSFAAMQQGGYACMSAFREALLSATSDAARTIDAL